MQYRELHGAGLKLSEVSFGAGTAAGLMIHSSPAEQRAAVEHAMSLGVNAFDTSPIYGMGCSEVNLGNALSGYDDAVITTKVAITPEHLLTGSIGQCIRRSVQASLRRLRRDSIDILLIHNGVHFQRLHPLTADPGDPYDPMQDLPHLTFDEIMGENGAWQTIRELKKSGLIKSFGISGQDNDPDLMRALIGAGVLDIVNQPLNLLNPTPVAGRKGEGFLADVEENFVEYDHFCEFAAANDCAVSIISPVAAGVLTTAAQSGITPPSVSEWKDRFPFDGHYARELRRAAAFVPVAEQAGITIADLAYRFVLSTPGFVTVLGGFSDISQLEQAVTSVEQGPLPADVMAELHRIWQAPSEPGSGA
ncbi:aldo/keto reductase [Gordonia sp. KTR9]|uniref:aldo/keto reductase n=1 Tax=Gordonia sp. KTR9 TaxID=337191 RepID=UPI00027DD825|nr:aldo/keto reductase [Gordonia sp. KTR9]AFR47367.1 aryl- alcohol dehydrogenase-like predicted oxidoreductase [Gordonia sp. KTR9]